MDFIMGEKLNNLKSHFLPERLTNIGPDYTNRCRIATFLGYVSQEKLISSIFSSDNHDFRFLRF